MSERAKMYRGESPQAWEHVYALAYQHNPRTGFAVMPGHDHESDFFITAVRLAAIARHTNGTGPNDPVFIGSMCYADESCAFSQDLQDRPHRAPFGRFSGYQVSSVDGGRWVEGAWRYSCGQRTVPADGRYTQELVPIDLVVMHSTHRLPWSMPHAQAVLRLCAPAAMVIVQHWEHDSTRDIAELVARDGRFRFRGSVLIDGLRYATLAMADATVQENGVLE